MPTPRRLLALVLAAGIVGLSAPARSDAQGLGARLKQRAEEAAKRKIEQRTERRAGEATDAALDKAECAASDNLCLEKAAEKDRAAGSATGSAPAGKPGEGVWANYDFRPGDRPLFVTDFSQDEVGNFPQRLELTSGNMEVVEWSGRRFLRATSEFEFRIPLAEQLPERFTLEFDLRGSYHTASQTTVKVDFGNGVRGDYASCSPVEAGLYGNGGTERKAVLDLSTRRFGTSVIRCRVMADGKYAKTYVNEIRTANHPNANLGRARAITISGFVVEPNDIMIGDIRVAAGGRKLYDALAASGRVATQGILFDTGSDRIRPESTPTLREIGTMLTEHADLRLVIEGHTDNVGDPKANEALSAKRAAAVRQYLVDRHGVDGSRLTAKGLGASKPAVPNTTAEGRQQNRRVELVKQ